MPENKELEWGTENPHPLSRIKTELVWEGKYDEYGNRRHIRLPITPMPLQRIETIDEPRDRTYAQGSLFDEKKAHPDEFRNMLIWGDNKLTIAASLERFRGKVDLIYIDPPFDVGADFTLNVQIGETERLEKEQSILEAVAYRDTWGKGTDSYLFMMYERLVLMRDLLTDEGSIYVHMGPNVSHYVRAMIDEVFGIENFVNEIIWRRAFGHSDSNRCGIIHDLILFYGKGNKRIWNQILQAPDKGYIDTFFDQYDEVRGERYQRLSLSAGGLSGGGYTYEYKGVHTLWRCPLETLKRHDAEGRLHWPKKRGGVPRLKRYESEYEGVPLQDIWTDISKIHNQSSELTGYDTQKPEALLERIIKASSNKGDLVADFFCGSGTTLAVAEKLGRRWIGVDLGRYGIHTTRKRIIQVQRQLHSESKLYRPFDVYNLGRYERQWWQLERLKGADKEHRRIVMDFYKGAPISQSPNPLLHGTKSGAYVHIDQIDSIFTYDELRSVAEAAKSAGGREVHCLAWEFEMELARRKQALETEIGIKIRLLHIPREIMEPNRTTVQFFEAGSLQVEDIRKGKKIDVKLVNFMPALAEAPEKEIVALRERAVNSPFDFIDFWAVDFESREGKPFEHHWQDFRTRKDRSLKTETDIGWEYDKSGKKSICVKVIDVFGVDTTTVIEVEV